MSFPIKDCILSNKFNLPFRSLRYSKLFKSDLIISVSICILLIFVKNSSIFLILKSPSVPISEPLSSYILLRLLNPFCVFTVPMILPKTISFKNACWNPKKLALISKLPVDPSKFDVQFTICKQ